jgi:hypothetical protein
LFHKLCSIKHHSGEFIERFNESWVYLTTIASNRGFWLKKNLRKTSAYDSRSKIMVRIRWNPLGFYLLNTLEKIVVFQAGTNVIISLQFSSCSDKNWWREISIFMQITRESTPLKSAVILSRKSSTYPHPYTWFPWPCAIWLLSVLTYETL